jgi:hypothetical protein
VGLSYQQQVNPSNQKEIACHVLALPVPGFGHMGIVCVILGGPNSHHVYVLPGILPQGSEVIKTRATALE